MTDDLLASHAIVAKGLAYTREHFEVLPGKFVGHTPVVEYEAALDVVVGNFGVLLAERDHFKARTEEVEAVLLQTAGDLINERDRARDVAVALEQELAEIRSAFREVLELHEQPPREDAAGVYPWFSGDIGVDEMAGYRAMLGDGS